MNSYVIIGLATMLTYALVATIVATTTTSVYAQTDPQRNNFGEGASFLGETGQMGTHSSTSDTDPTDPQRSGIGNVLNPGDPSCLEKLQYL